MIPKLFLLLFAVKRQFSWFTYLHSSQTRALKKMDKKLFTSLCASPYDFKYLMYLESELEEDVHQIWRDLLDIILWSKLFYFTFIICDET